MSHSQHPAADRVEAFIAAIDNYEPKHLAGHEDAFRLFARAVSRSIDGRYLTRHPPAELLVDLEGAMLHVMRREENEIKVYLGLVEGSKHRGVLITCMPDQAFIYSTVRLCLEQLNVRIYRTINSIMPVARDLTGEITSIGARDAPGESFMWFEVEASELAGRAAEIERYVRLRLEQGRLAVAEFPSLKAMTQALAARFDGLARLRPDEKQIHEDNARLLRWLLDGHFVFLGSRFLRSPDRAPADPVGDFGLGRGSFDPLVAGLQIEEAEQAVFETGGIAPYLWVRKSRAESWTYRPGRMDHVLVQCFDAQGEPAGLLIIEGLFSFQALAEPRNAVPQLDRVLARLHTQLQASEGSHRYRTIRNAFNSLPLEYLFSLQFEDVQKLVEQVLDVDVENRMQLHITADEMQNTAFVFVAVPRASYSDELRADVRKLLSQRLHASSVDDGTYAGNTNSVTFHYFLTGVDVPDDRSEEQLRAAIEQMASPWSERLYDEMRRRAHVSEARHLHSLYGEAFHARYREVTSVGRAVRDIEILEQLSDENSFDCDLYREQGDEQLGVTRLRLFNTEKMLLSHVLPLLDNLGLVVIDQFPTAVHVPGRPERWISTFRVGGVEGLTIDLVTRRNRLRNAIRALVRGAMSSDALNRLLLAADIPWTYVVLVRCLHHYARQIGLPYGLATVQEALLGHGNVVRVLTELFRAKFDPDIEGHSGNEVDERRLALVERTRRAVEDQLASVDDLTGDEILRTLYQIIDAAVRTSFYARDPMKQSHLAIKLDPSRIERMPLPRPYREIYVHHPKVAGLHLRSSPVARGGLRWSDRLLDFRTEVLSLMATQTLKNALIVPSGAKGGFILQQPPSDLAQRREDADKYYRVFIDGLLDVTDNLVDGEVVTPPRVLRYDGLDHYLVVAADKGTAHQSDNANAIAERRGFWLGDAFASGGSKGYDHKVLGITAKGAWECVKRHFRELGADPENDRITVAGIGDMSGDVFGNGMLLSRSMQLLAAFDHRHIFIDPDPDPAVSFEARAALFAKGRSSWEDYPRAAMSAGGGIYPRTAKSITLSEQARRILGIELARVSGQQLVQAVLKMPVDLLWNGGIGTYIKASSETHLDAGDMTNDAVRVDATEVRARVIAEGGNLGITQAGRVELATKGVRLNTDAVDNSAGVDMSDHEVNLKILFTHARAAGTIADAAERDALMLEIQEDVSRMVLSNNRLQSRMLSLDELRSRRDPSRFTRAMRALAERMSFNRRDYHLPGERVVGQRAQRGVGLFRPELAILAAYAKLDLRQHLTKEQMLDAAAIKTYCTHYYPPTIAQRFAADIESHPLAQSIAATVLTNWLIADAGCTWLSESLAMSGQPTSAVLRAYFEATELLTARELKREIDNFETKLGSAFEYDVRLRIEDSIETASAWLLRRAKPVSDNWRATFQAVADGMEERAGECDVVSSRLRAAGVDADFCRRMLVCAYIDDLIDITELAQRSAIGPLDASRAWYHVGESTHLLATLRAADATNAESEFDRPARAALRYRIRGQLVELALALLREQPAVAQQARVARLEQIGHELEPLRHGQTTVSELVVVVDRVDRHLRNLTAVAV